MERDPVLIDLALQGGGSRGAVTWGVLDRLLEEPWLQIAGISGTSAGAMNAAVLADGWVDEGAEGARAALEKFWQRVSRAAAFSPLLCAKSGHWQSVIRTTRLRDRTTAVAR
jgi:NTE family protein